MDPINFEVDPLGLTLVPKAPHGRVWGQLQIFHSQIIPNKFYDTIPGIEASFRAVKGGGRTEAEEQTNMEVEILI